MEQDYREHPDVVWNRMCSALAAYVDRFGHFRVPVDVTVNGMNLSQWVTRQRTGERRGDQPGWRARRLREIPGWSVEYPHVDRFWANHAGYLAAVRSGGAKPRSLLGWGNGIRSWRRELQARGRDLPDWQ